MLSHLPLHDPQPNAAEFTDILMGRWPPGRTPLVEYIVDDVVLRGVVTELLGREWVPYGADRKDRERYLDNFIAFWRSMGYDFVRLEIGLPFVERHVMGKDPTPLADQQRAWADEHVGSIATWQDFECYPWPTLDAVDFFPLEYINANLPEGMGFITCHGAGVFEHLSFIMSIEGLCLALCENPELVKAVADKVGGLIAAFYGRILQLDRLVAVLQGDDMGFRTATLVGPPELRAYCLPWLKRYAAMTHARSLPFFLHSCGNLETIMDDLIDDVGIDGKHSFEDAIIPVQDFQARYGGRIAVLGGLDINVLAAGTIEVVRQQTRFLIETCGSRGRYAIGSGNSIPSYVPTRNYLAMVDTAIDMGSAART